MNKVTMRTVWVLCSVMVTLGAQGAAYYGTTEDYYPDSTHEPCGGYLYGGNGSFHSPNYPNRYPSNSLCTWYISTGGSAVQLVLFDVNIEAHTNCDYDALYIYDGSSTNSTLLGKVCGNNNNMIFHSTGAYMTVQFRSDHSGTFFGFRADYRAVGSCRNNCGYQVGSCSCSSSCQYRGNCCHDYTDYCSYGTTPTPGATCGGSFYGRNGSFHSPNYPNRYPSNSLCTWYISPGGSAVQLVLFDVNIQAMTNCSADALYIYDGSSTNSTLLGKVCGNNNNMIFHSTGAYMTVQFRSDHSGTFFGFRADYRAVDSCRNNCGYQVGSCSCSSSCQYRGDCCHDYTDYCSYGTTPTPASCGGSLYGAYGSFYSPNYPNRYPSNSRCTWYISPGSSAVELALFDVNIEAHANCDYDALYIYDGSSTNSTLLGKVCGNKNNVTFHSTGAYMTVQFRSDDSGTFFGFRASYRAAVRPSCRYNCGYDMGSCSCSSSCQYYGNCCYDYYSQCHYDYTTPYPEETTGQPSCRYNCGYDMGSCSCSSSCQYYGNCCHDYYSQCHYDYTTPYPEETTGQPSCRYNCGYDMGSCSCSSSCQYYGNCCHDYYSQCHYDYTTPYPEGTAGQPSCRYNCGYYVGNCSCTSSCQYYGNCCHDFYNYCHATTEAQPSCRYNCGSHLGSCSCSSSCEYIGNCCYDYYSHCAGSTDPPSTGAPCGGSLFGSGTFSSPYYPNYYPDNSRCVWQLRVSNDHRINLAFTFLQLENCCSCDYIEVYDGPSVGYNYLGKLCSPDNATRTSFHSSSNYLTVLFRSDHSVVAQGFTAKFTSSLSSSKGQVTCFSDKMNIVIQRSYLESLGYSGYRLSLNHPNCTSNVLQSQVVFNYPINACGTERKFVNGRTVYTNAVRAYPSSLGQIIRQPYLKMNIECEMEQSSLSQIMYLSENIDNTTITGTGSFNTSMDFYTSRNFYNKVTQFPYVVTLNQDLYIQVDLRNRDKSLVVFMDTCVASPSAHDFQTRKYELVSEGCARDSTYYTILTGEAGFARFTFKALQFVKGTDSVYLQCKVRICPVSSSTSCRPRCNRRKTRDLGTKHDTQTLVLGPIQLKDPEEKKEETKQDDKA